MWSRSNSVIISRIGSVELALDQVPTPFSKPKKIKDIQCLEGRKTSSLFDLKQMYGWWPVFGEIETKGKKDPSLMVSNTFRLIYNWWWFWYKAEIWFSLYLVYNSSVCVILQDVLLRNMFCSFKLPTGQDFECWFLCRAKLNWPWSCWMNKRHLRNQQQTHVKNLTLTQP